MQHCPEDRYWSDALSRYHQLREAGQKQIIIDLESVVEYEG